MAVAKEKRMSAMVPIYGNLIIKNKETGKTIADVPATVKEDVRKWLIENGHGELAEEE